MVFASSVNCVQSHWRVEPTTKYEKNDTMHAEEDQ